MQIKWSDKFKSGVAKLDNQHKELIELINKLQRRIIKGGGKEEIGKVIESIYEHKSNHFAEEERLMLDHNYPQYEQHAKEHGEMLDKLSKLKEDLAAGNNMATVELTGFLSDWLVNHISGMDLKYGKFFNDRGVY